MKPSVALCVSFLLVSVTIDGIKASLELPKTYCALTRSHPVERAFYEQQDRVQAGMNKVVLIAAPCDGIKSLRTKGAAPRYGIWLMQSPGGVSRKVPDSVPRQAVLDAMAQSIPKLDTDAVMGRVAGRAQKEGIDLKVNSSGLIDQDTNGVYLGIAGDVANATRSESFAGVAGLTVVSGRMFSLNMYDLFENRATFDRLLVSVKDTIGRSVVTSEKIVQKPTPDKSLPAGMKPLKPSRPLPVKPEQQAAL